MSMVTVENTPIVASEEERQDLMRLARFLETQAVAPMRLMGANGESIPVPEVALRVLDAALAALDLDQAVSVVPMMAGLTTQQAAQFLNVGHEYLLQLLAVGELSAFEQNGEQRVRAGDLLRHKAQRRAHEREGLRELTRLSEDYGLYDANFPGADKR